MPFRDHLLFKHQNLLPGGNENLLPGSEILLGTVSPSETPVSREKRSPETCNFGFVEGAPLACNKP